MKVLNLFAGLGGNRKLWEGCSVTAVELNRDIAEVYADQHPQDNLVIGDAHAYLLNHFHEFDFIWSSPPCQTHSRMAVATRHTLKRYPDMQLYQEILFLKQYAKCSWVVENVTPYYTPLIVGKKCGRHLFWSNFDFPEFDVPAPAGFINNGTQAGKQVLMDWLGIQYEHSIYYGGNHCPVQVLRNCVHPLLGKHVYDHFIKAEVNKL